MGDDPEADAEAGDADDRDAGGADRESDASDDEGSSSAPGDPDDSDQTPDPDDSDQTPDPDDSDQAESPPPGGSTAAEGPSGTDDAVPSETGGDGSVDGDRAEDAEDSDSADEGSDMYADLPTWGSEEIAGDPEATEGESSDGGSTAVDEGGTDSTDDGDSIGFDNSTAAAAATAAAERRREERAAEAEQEPAADAGDRELEPEEPDVDLSFGVDDQSGPSSDEEMPLAEHIDEMVRRLAVVLAVGSVVTLLLFPGADILNAYAGTSLPTATDVINYLWNAHIPGAETVEGRRPRVYGPLELLLTELKVAGLAGFVVSLPVFVYETYLFMRPGLYPHERRYYLSAVPTSVVLAFIGIAFAHFVVLPAIFAYFTSYTTQAATVAFGLRETFSLILVLMGYMALVFQIPLFIMLAIMMNLVTRSWLEDKRLLFWGGFLGLSFIVSPDPTGMAPIIVAATMIALFEGTLALLRWTGN